MDKLAIFWRDRSDRCFTWFHFVASEGEFSFERARRLLASVASLSCLQVYGGVFNQTLLPVDLATPPPLSGVRERLEMNLFPDAPLQPKLGIALLKFSIPGPIDGMRVMGEAGRPDEDSPLWDFFRRQIVPYLSLPRGVGVLRKSSFVQSIWIRQIQSDLSLPPVDAAISANEEHLRRAEWHLTKCYEIGRDPTEREIRSVDSYRDRLVWLRTLQKLEAELYEQAVALDPSFEKPVRRGRRKAPIVRPKPIVESKPVVQPSIQKRRERLLPLFDRLDASLSTNLVSQPPVQPSPLPQPQSDTYTQTLSALQTHYQQIQSETTFRQKSRISSRGRYSTKVAAERLGVAIETVRRWCRVGHLAAVRDGRVWLVSAASVRRLQRERAGLKRDRP